MPFIETEASVRYEVIDGKRVPIITPKTEIATFEISRVVSYISNKAKLVEKTFLV